MIGLDNITYITVYVI